MALIELFHWLSYFKKKRKLENLSQKDLTKQELITLGQALVGVAVIMGSLLALAWWILRR